MGFGIIECCVSIIQVRTYGTLSGGLERLHREFLHFRDTTFFSSFSFSFFLHPPFFWIQSQIRLSHYPTARHRPYIIDSLS